MARKLAASQLAQLDQDDPFEGLTSKQYAFVMASFSGSSDADAYRQSYDTEGMDAVTLYHNAAALAHHPLVVTKLRALRIKTDNHATLVPLVSREWITQGIANLALNADKDSVKLAAYGMLGKTVGIDMFRETTRHEHVARTPEQIDVELKEKLSALRDAITIDGEARDASAAPKAPSAQPRKRRR